MEHLDFFGVNQNLTYLTLFGKSTEDIPRLLPADSSLSTVDKQSHIYAIVCHRHVRPVPRQVLAVRVDQSDLMGAVSL